jgi:hypothetical protein
MNLSTIAKAILANQTSAGAISRSAIDSALSFEERGEAMRLGWLEARDDGYLGISSSAGPAAQLRAAAATDGFSGPPAFVDFNAPAPDTFAPYRRFESISPVVEAADPDVGDEVVVADQGKTYQASVAGRNADGSFKLSFSGAEKPGRDTYRKEEMRVTRTVGKAPQAPAVEAPPANPTVAKTTTSPVAPGLATRS